MQRRFSLPWLARLAIVLALLVGCERLGRKPTPTPAPTSESRAEPATTRKLTATYNAQGELRGVSDESGQPVTASALVAQLPASLPHTPSRIPFAQMAAALSGLTSLEGAIYDPTGAQLILYGRQVPGAPTLRPDDLAVALAHVYAGELPWVSIDPGPTKAEMLVTLSPQAANTHLGLAMFEADRQMKVLGQGKDNISGQAVTSQVPGFKNLIDLSLSRPGEEEGESWHRFWIQVDRMQLALRPDKLAVAFRDSVLSVRTEYLGANLEPLPQPRSDPVAEAFANHLSQHYAQYAAERPVFAEVYNQARLVGLAQWIKLAEIPLDLSWLESQGAPAVRTPLTTPAITVTGEKQEGNVTHTVSLYGGVKLQFENEYAQPSAADEALWSRLLSVPQGPDATWKVGDTPQASRAVAVPLVRPSLVGAYLGAVIHDLDLPGTPALRFSRRYDSTSPEAGTLGPGWLIDLPALQFPQPKHSYSLGNDQSKIELYPTGVWADPLTAQQVRYELQGRYDDGRIAYRPAAAGDASELVLLSDGTFSLARPGRTAYRFDPAGRLLRQQATGGQAIDYSYRDGRLAAVERAGVRIDLKYDAQGRLLEARAAGGEARLYTYTQDGHLASVTDGHGSPLAQYEYDTQGRLAVERDGQGQILRRNVYDEAGCLREWQDAEAEYAVTLGAQQSSITRTPRQALQEGPILAAGRSPSAEFARRPEVQAFRQALGQGYDSFLSDLAVCEELLNDHLPFVYAARLGGQLYLLVEGQPADPKLQKGQYLRTERGQLAAALKSLPVPLPAGPLLALGTGCRGESLEDELPKQMIFRAEGLSFEMVAGNLLATMVAGPLQPGNTAIHIELPESADELAGQALPPGDWPRWLPLPAHWKGLAEGFGYTLDRGEGSRSQRIHQSLREKANVVIVVAHSDGSLIYTRDGSPFSPADEPAVLKSRPIVILVSCDTARVVDAPSLAKKLVDQGARAVLAPDVQVPANDLTFLEQLLTFSRQVAPGEGFVQILQRTYDALRGAGKYIHFRLLIGERMPDSPIEALV